MTRRLAVAVAALAISLCAVGIAVEPLKAPAFTRILVERYAEPEAAGLSDTEMVRTAEQVRHYVASPSGGEGLPETVSGRPGFDASAVSHLDDVARVLRGARVLTLALALLLLVAGAVALKAGERRDVARALRAGAVASVAAVALAALVAVSDFEAFFAAFHGVFFADGTWTFPYDSLLIRLFPERFWIAAGASWGVVTVALAGLLAAASARIGRVGTVRERGPEN